MSQRGATKAEVMKSIEEGERRSAHGTRIECRRTFPFDGSWKGRRYTAKRVVPIIEEKTDRLVIVTVFVYYFGQEENP